MINNAKQKAHLADTNEPLVSFGGGSLGIGVIWSYDIAQEQASSKSLYNIIQ